MKRPDRVLQIMSQDNKSLYEEENNEVVTMYLTVGQGNEEDDTDHTWTEINSYPLSYYEEHSITPYKCEAVLQSAMKPARWKENSATVTGLPTLRCSLEGRALPGSSRRATGSRSRTAMVIIMDKRQFH